MAPLILSTTTGMLGTAGWRGSSEMATYDASVRRTLPTQTDIRDHREHCSVDPEKLATIGCAAGQQVRIRRNDVEYGLYTVSEVRQENPDNVVRLGLSGRQRLGTSDEFDAVIDSQVPNPTMTESEADEASEFIERLADNGQQSTLIAIAPHGGDIEQHTDDQAERVAAQLAAKAVSSWRCKGWNHHRGGASLRWHITSTDINEKSFPLLNSVIRRRFSYAVAFHGLNEDRILIGGTASNPLKLEIKDAIERATAGSGIAVCIARPDEKAGGDDPANIVNRLTVHGANGIQIEQSRQARADHWRTIADAVANVYRPKL